MPYSGPNDRSLPSNVKKMPTRKRRQWVEVFNSVMSRGGSESSAFAQANGVAGKEATPPFTLDDLRMAIKAKAGPDDDIEAAVREVAEKCGMEYAIPAISVVEWQPFDGATSFDELDSYHESEHLAMNTHEVTSQFQAIVNNVLASEMSMAEKTAAINAAASELQNRVENPPPMMKEEGGIKGWWAKFLGKKTKKPTPIPEGGSFTVYKDVDDRWRWLAVYSNNFYDRDGEVFTEAAHKEYIAWAEKTGQYPQLWLWHTPGTKCGKADLLDFSDGLAIASGVFEKDCEDVALALAADKGLGVSHGYRFESEHLDKDGSYSRYRTFEISPLPLEKAANEGTLFLSEKEDFDMALTKEKRDYLASKLGEERMKRLEPQLEALSKDLKESGIAWKDVAETLTEAPPAAPAADVSSTTVQTPANAAGGEPEKKPETPAPVAGLTAEDVKNAVVAALAPIEERMKALEAKDDEKIASWFGPRYGQRPTESNKGVDGRTSLKQDEADAQKAADEADAQQKPGGDSWYLQNLARTLVGPTSG